MKFNNHYNLLFHIITNYETLKNNLILCKPELITEDFIPSNDYIYWHTKNIGTVLSDIKITSCIVDYKEILKKSKKYYLNIIINNKSDFLQYAFHDIFFEPIRIAFCISGFMLNYNLTLHALNQYFKNYHVDYYVCTYDIVGYEEQKFNIDDLKNIIPIKKYIIKEYSKNYKKVSNNIDINNLYYQTLNAYDCYNQINENYLIYIHIRPNINLQNLTDIVDKYYDDIINSYIIMHHNISNQLINSNLIETLQSSLESIKIPKDGVIICNIFTADIYFKFHLEIHLFMNKPVLKIKGIEDKNISNEDEEQMDRSPEETLFYYLINKNINIITDNIYKINNTRPNFGPINRSVILHNLNRKK